MMSGAAVTRYFAVLTILLMIGLVLTRLFIMKRSGVHAMHFGQTDKTDYFIPPVALFYFYLIFAAAFGWPVPTTRELFDSEGIRWLGVALCLAGVTLLAWSLVRAELSRRHRHGATRQAGHNRRLLVEPKSHLRGIRADPARPVPHLLGLVPAGVSRRGLLAPSPPGPARGGVPEGTIRSRLRGVSPAATAVRVGLPARAYGLPVSCRPCASI